MTVKTTKWDPAEHLETPEDVAMYLSVVLEENDPALLSVALGDIARSKGMAALSKETGLTKQGLYKALSENGDPRLSTLMKVTKSLGFQLSIKPAA